VIDFAISFLRQAYGHGDEEAFCRYTVVSCDRVTTCEFGKLKNDGFLAADRVTSFASQT
jgi:hypothetical protein